MVTDNLLYNRLIDELKRLHYLNCSLSLLGWDEQVNLPKGSAEQRAQQSAVLADIIHREFTHPQIGQWLNDLEAITDTLSDQKLTVIREVRRKYDRAIKLPAEFVTRKSVLDSQAYHAWADARAKNNFSLFSPFLKEQIELSIEESQYLGYDRKNAYDFHIDKHDPALNTEIINDLFDELKKDLIPLVRKILDSPVKADTSIFKCFPVNLQESFLREVTTTIGFDYNRGRIDQAQHPFCGGDGSDTRMTTRFNINNPLDSLYSSIHETGHGLYEQGLPLEHLGTALGEAVGMAVHESQSRLWENQVARSKAFWDYWEDKYRLLFINQLSGISEKEFYLAINEVTLNPIRVNSDEVTYNLHIILRFELEKRLIAGELNVKDLPSEWNRLSLDIIGLKPKNDNEGVLQDIHWSSGSFGYFPSYCLGNMLAAQFWYSALREIPDLEKDFRRGDFSQLLNWLKKKIYRYGKQYDTLTLTKMVSGDDLSPKYLITYLKEHYLPLYLQPQL